jgi:hypothetical protein
MRSTSLPLKLFTTLWRNTVRRSLFPLYQYEKLFCFSYFSPHRRNSSPLWQNFPPLWQYSVRESLFPAYPYEKLFCFHSYSSSLWRNWARESLFSSYPYEKTFCFYSYSAPLWRYSVRGFLFHSYQYGKTFCFYSYCTPLCEGLYSHRTSLERSSASTHTLRHSGGTRYEGLNSFVPEWEDLCFYSYSAQLWRNSVLGSLFPSYQYGKTFASTHTLRHSGGTRCEGLYIQLHTWWNHIGYYHLLHPVLGVGGRVLFEFLNSHTGCQPQLRVSS